MSITIESVFGLEKNVLLNGKDTPPTIKPETPGFEVLCATNCAKADSPQTKLKI